MYTKPLIALGLLCSLVLLLAWVVSVTPHTRQSTPRVFGTYASSSSTTLPSYASTTSFSFTPSWLRTPQGEQSTTSAEAYVATTTSQALSTLFSSIIAPVSRTPELLWDGELRIDTSITQEKQRASTQEALYVYGNATGEIISTFERTHSYQTTTLGTYIEERTTGKAIESLAAEYDTLVEELEGIAVPQEASSAHSSLTAAYQSLAAQLRVLATTTDDSGIITEILAYNETAQEVGNSLVTLVRLFQTYGVSFSPSEPGHAFVFSLQ